MVKFWGFAGNCAAFQVIFMFDLIAASLRELFDCLLLSFKLLVAANPS